MIARLELSDEEFVTLIACVGVALSLRYGKPGERHMAALNKLSPEVIGVLLAKLNAGMRDALTIPPGAEHG